MVDSVSHPTNFFTKIMSQKKLLNFVFRCLSCFVKKIRLFTKMLNINDMICENMSKSQSMN